MDPKQASNMYMSVLNSQKPKEDRYSLDSDRVPKMSQEDRERQELEILRAKPLKELTDEDNARMELLEQKHGAEAIAPPARVEDKRDKAAQQIEAIPTGKALDEMKRPKKKAKKEEDEDESAMTPTTITGVM